MSILADSATQYLAQAINGIGYEKKLDIDKAFTRFSVQTTAQNYINKY